MISEQGHGSSRGIQAPIPRASDYASHSRKSYSEPVFRQTTENFIRVIENAFRHFGGGTSTLVIDNLRAAVKNADWFDPDLNPKVLEFARHYGFVILPTKPYTPRHKGKIESGIKYVKNNALKGRTFSSLTEEKIFLADWDTNVADTRIHGTTKKQVRRMFEEEQAALLPLPLTPFPFYHEGRRKVHLPATGTAPVPGASARDRIHCGPNKAPSRYCAGGCRRQRGGRQTEKAPSAVPPSGTNR